MTMAICPICGEPLTMADDYIEHILCEEHIWCSNCTYVRSYAYGGYHTIIRGKQFIWHYTTDQQTVERIEAVIKRSIEHYRRRI